MEVLDRIGQSSGGQVGFTSAPGPRCAIRLLS
jgi:hypothetical protein